MNITLSKNSKIENVDFNNLTFGKIFTDHMFVCDYFNGKWNDERIIPYSDIKISPSARVFHYGQAIFEGMKAFKTNDNNILLFRPDENFKRFNLSSERLAIPEIPKNIFFNGLNELLKADHQWIKKGVGNSLYVRPFVIASEESINASEADFYKFMIICTPAKSYYENQEIWVKIEERYSRAAKGGVGFAKASGNYAAQFYPTKVAKDEGFQQIIWTDSNYHDKIEEAGTMNLFFRINNELITSPISDSILDGITRKSIIDISKSMGLDVIEREITVSELLSTHESGELKEIFGTGTAVAVLPISGFGYRDKKFLINPKCQQISIDLKNKLQNIQYGITESFSEWQYKVS